MLKKLTEHELFWMALGDGYDAHPEGWEALVQADEVLRKRWEIAVKHASVEKYRMAVVVRRPWLAKALLSLRRAKRKGITPFAISINSADSHVQSIQATLRSEPKSLAKPTKVSEMENEACTWVTLGLGEILAVHFAPLGDHEFDVSFETSTGDKGTLTPDKVDEKKGFFSVGWKLESDEAPVCLTFLSKHAEQIKEMSMVIILQLDDSSLS